MMRELLPVPCPRCDEKQNTHAGDFDPDRVPFGQVLCMACGHVFKRGEYMAGLERATRDSDARLAQRRRGLR
jgi:hypothetical protein